MVFFDNQRQFFNTHKTLSYKYRIDKLKSLKNSIIKNKDKIEEALFLDLGKSATESYMCEIGLTLSGISQLIKNLKRLMKKKRVKTPIAQFPSKSYIVPSPYGQVLIISPWNYPFLLAMDPFAAAIASGNTVILKPSEYSVNVSNVLKLIIEECFRDEEAYVALGDASVSTELLKQDFNYIFFTGGTNVGKIVYEAASKKLIPVTLELGGKSPAIITDSAKIDLACKRIVFGKFINAGQTCVAPDYVLVDKKISKEVINGINKYIKILYDDYKNNKDFGHIISKRHFERLINLIDYNKVIIGGNNDAESLKIEPTVMYPVTNEDLIMSEEIFGPILPILEYEDMDELYNIINENKNPLALYLFTSDNKIEKKIVEEISFGGGCINDTIIHLSTPYLPFGGVGASGIGAYHGDASFSTFSHYKSVIKKSNKIDLPMRYTPYTKSKENLIKKFLK